MAKFLCCFLLLAFVADPPAPPGTERIGDNLFMDKRPVAAVDYREFLAYVERTGFENLRFADLQPADSLPAAEAEPVTGLTGRQIDWYCAWRSVVVTQIKNDPAIRCSRPGYWAKFDRHDPGHLLKIVYRLPFQKEYPRRWEKEKCRERTADGLANPAETAVYGFRCVAEFVPIE